MKLLSIPSDVFTTETVQPRKSNTKRLTAFKLFYDSSQSSADLRRACLCLRLTSIAVAITAKKRPKDSEEGTVPTLVRLGRREVEMRTTELLASMFPKLSSDPFLNLDDAVPALLVTQGHIILRFSEYQNYPCRLWLMTKKYNESGYVIECEKFMTVGPTELDAGYSWQLQREALSFSAYSESLAYLLSQQVQDELVGIVENSS
eukprot:8795973-Karenia_brevis.AAC.1